MGFEWNFIKRTTHRSVTKTIITWKIYKINAPNQKRSMFRNISHILIFWSLRLKKCHNSLNFVNIKVRLSLGYFLGFMEHFYEEEILTKMRPRMTFKVELCHNCRSSGPIDTNLIFKVGVTDWQGIRMDRIKNFRRYLPWLYQKLCLAI